MRAGVSGFFSKAEPLDDLVPALRSVYRGSPYIPSAVRGLREEGHAKVADCASSLAGDAEVWGVAGVPALSPREREVLRC